MWFFFLFHNTIQLTLLVPTKTWTQTRTRTRTRIRTRIRTRTQTRIRTRTRTKTRTPTQTENLSLLTTIIAIEVFYYSAICCPIPIPSEKNEINSAPIFCGHGFQRVKQIKLTSDQGSDHRHTSHTQSSSFIHTHIFITGFRIKWIQSLNLSIPQFGLILIVH